MNDVWKNRLRIIVLVFLALVTLLSVTHYMDFMFSGLVPAVRRNMECLNGVDRDNAFSLSFIISTMRSNLLGALLLFAGNYGKGLFFIHLLLIIWATCLLPRIRILYQIIVLALVSALCLLLVELLSRTFGGSIISTMS